MDAPVRRFPWPVYLIVFFVIVLVAALPMIGVMAASWIAETNRCGLDEGSVHACLVGGEDWGELLYGLFVMGWFALVTIPLGLMAVAVLAIAFVIHLVVFLTRNRSRQIAP